MTVTWPAGSDATSGVSGYELQRQIDSGPWVTALTTSARSVRVGETFGHLYQYRLRSRDAAGNWSGWATTAAERSGVFQESSTAIRWTGTWTRYSYANASGGATRWSATNGARAQLSTSARAIAIVAPLGPTRGQAGVYVDGVYKGLVSLYRSTGLSRSIVYVATFPSVAAHRIEFRVSGTRRVDLDAFVILR